MAGQGEVLERLDRDTEAKRAIAADLRAKYGLK
jgi:hypothetical protein